MGLGSRRRSAPRQPQTESAEATVARVREALSTHLDIARGAGGNDADISVRYVLDLLNPDGIWRHVRESKTEVPRLPANIDAMTGCLPVTPESR